MRFFDQQCKHYKSANFVLLFGFSSPKQFENIYNILVIVSTTFNNANIFNYKKEHDIFAFS